MPVKYEYDQNSNIVHTRPYGELSTSEMKVYFKELINDDEIKTGFVEVVHFENVENFLFSSNEASSIFELYNKLKENKRLRATVYIGERDIHFGVARMLETLHEINNQKDDVFVLRNEVEADKIFNNIFS